MFKMTFTVLLIFATFLAVAETTGLKKVNYQDETSDKKDEGASSPGLSPEEAQKLTDNINALKAKQAESQKALDELDNDE